MSKVLQEFREFVSRGSVLDLAIGFITGTAFSTVVKSFVSDILMPPTGLLLGKVDFPNLFIVLREGEKPGPYVTLASAQEAGAVTLNYGLCASSVASFLIIAVVLFALVRSINRLRQAPPRQETATKECPSVTQQSRRRLSAVQTALQNFKGKGTTTGAASAPVGFQASPHFLRSFSHSSST